MLSPGRFLATGSVVAVLVLSLTARATTAGASQDDVTRFEMLYEELAPEQKALVDDWIARYSQLRGEDLAPDVYNQFPLSVKTTFAAVTHALTNTPLTDEEGRPLLSDQGESLTALGLVAKLDTVRGRVKGASGDEQFRIYVQLIPDAVDLLEESREFSRTHDNTVYHKGYPQNFRSASGVPSIQFSIARAGNVADIDVDYRSSKFPAALVNGHLSSANSDVRAGNNFTRHISVWQGLDNWWNGWEGLGDWFAALYGVRGLDIPDVAKEGDGAVEDAFHDFLQSWLVDERPDIAMSYFSNEIYKCFEEGETNTDTDATVEQRMYRKMSETVRVIGNPRHLSSVVEGVFLTSLELPSVQNNPYHSEFVLYRVPPERVAEFECQFRNLSIPKARAAQLHRSGDYLLGTFFLKSGELRGVTAALLWSREDEGWKMVSFELEPATGLVPDLHAPPAVPMARGEAEVAVEPELLQASEEFMTAWFVDNDYDAALELVTPDAYRCADLFGDTDASASSDPDPRQQFLDALRTVGEFVGDVDRNTLADAIAGIEPWSAQFRDVTPEGSASTLIAIPDDEASVYRCVDDSTDARPSRRLQEASYGNFFGSAFRLQLASGEQPAAFLVLWGKEDSAWRAVAFDIVDN